MNCPPPTGPVFVENFMSSPQFKVTYRGVRGSIPTPLLASEIEEKVTRILETVTPDDLKDMASRKAFIQNLPIHLKGCFGGNSACVQVEAGGHLIIFDAGTGLRILGLDLLDKGFGQGEGEGHLFLSHTHWDHIMGLPFFVPFYRKGNRFKIYGAHPDLRDRLMNQQSPPHFPVPFTSYEADVEVVEIRDMECVELGPVRVTWKAMAHPGVSYTYRVEYEGKSVVYSTDAEYKRLEPEDLAPTVEFFRDADLLIFDSQYTFVEGIEKEDWGHSSTFIGVDLAVAANVKRLAFFHHEPTYTDTKLMSVFGQTKKYLKAIAPGNPLELMISCEGKTVDLMAD